MSPKTRKRYREAKPVRDELRALDHCEICGRVGGTLDVHEICRGPNRLKALDKRFALLLVCRWCHDQQLSSAVLWPEARQLAVLAQSRLLDWDLVSYLNLTNARAPSRIEIDEVVNYMDPKILKVEEVATGMRVNRRTVQSWIDSGALVAVDVRPTGATRAMWRIHAKDLLEFAQARKTQANG